MGRCNGIPLLILAIAVSGCACIKIRRLSMPAFVKNGTLDHVILDCEYEYDARLDRALVVKWFHESDPQPVYQWIPELDSRIARKEYGADPGYDLPGEKDPYKRSRALKIHLPTTKVSGKYKCEVTSHNSQDSMEDEMIVYTLPRDMSLNYSVSDGQVHLVCEVEGVHPVPEMELFLVLPASDNTTLIDGADIDYEMEDGAYEVEFSVDIPVEDLPSSGLPFFGCRVEINGTEFEREKRIPYFPNPIAAKQEGDFDDDDDDDDSANLSVSSLLSLVLPIIAFLVLT